ncbi:MMPL family transporter [bacterium]|nr:MMPL family transporter [bacterium]
MYHKIIKKITAILIKYSCVILILGIALTAVTTKYSIELFKNIETDFASLLPKGYPSVQRYEVIRDKFKKVKNLILVVKTEDAKTVKEILPDLAAHIEKHPDVKMVQFKKPGYDFFNKNKLLYLNFDDLKDFRDRIDRRIQREKLGGLYISFDDEGDDEPQTFEELKKKYSAKYSEGIISEYFTNDDETVFLMHIDPKTATTTNLNFSKTFFNNIKNTVEEWNIKDKDPTVEILWTGSIKTYLDEYYTTIDDLTRAGIISAIAIVLLILVYYRHWSALFFILIPLAMGLSWNFGAIYHIIGQLNMITAFLFSILFGLGIDFGIHMFSRYVEERKRSRDLSEAIFHMLAYTGRSSFTAGMTTCTVFFLLIVNDFKGFSEFGLIAGLGLITTLLAFYIILPAMLAVADKLHIYKIKTEIFKEVDSKLMGKAFPKPKLIVAASGVFVILSLVAMYFISFNYDFTELRIKVPATLQAKEKSYEVSKRRSVPSVVLLNGKDQAEAVRKAVEDLKKQPDSLIDSFRSVYTLVPNNQDEKMAVMKEIRTLLEDDVVDKLVKGEKREHLDDLKESTFAGPVKFEDLPKNITELFFGDESDRFEGNEELVYIFPKGEIELSDGRYALHFADEVRDIATNQGIFHAASSSVIFADVLAMMLRDSRRAVLFSFLCVGFLLFLDFKKTKKVVIVMIPLLCGTLWMLGTMVVTGGQLNFFNMIVLPTILGLGIDYGVHFYHRFEEEGYKNVMKVWRYTGNAILMTSLTTIAGFSGLIFTNHGGLRTIGTLAVIGITTCLIASVVFLPAILQLQSQKG